MIYSSNYHFEETIAMEDVDIVLGERIRSKRQELNFTLDELAKRSGVARTTISKIERDIISPSFSTLSKIVRGMDMRITQFFDDKHEETEVLLKKGDRVTIEHSVSNFLVESLTMNQQNMQMEVVEVTIESGKNCGTDSPHDGEDFLLCQQGSVEFQIGDKMHKLLKGDTLHFKPSEITCLYNNSNKQAKILWAHLPQKGGARRRKVSDSS